MASSRSRGAPESTFMKWLTELSLDIQHYTALISECLGQMADNQVRLRARVDDAAFAVCRLGREDGCSVPAEAILYVANKISLNMQNMETAVGDFKRRHDDILDSLNNISNYLEPCMQRTWEAAER